MNFDLMKVDSYYKYNKYDKIVYEKHVSEEGIVVNEKFAYYDDKQRLVKTIVLDPKGIPFNKVYTNEYVEFDMGFGIETTYTYRDNGFALHKVVSLSNNNGVILNSTDSQYTIESKEWYIDSHKKWNENNLLIYERLNWGWEAKYEYNKDGLMTLNHVIKSKDGPSKTEFIYDDKNRLIKQVASTGKVTEYKYDEKDKVIYKKESDGYLMKEYEIEIDGKKFIRTEIAYSRGKNSISDKEVSED